MTSYKNKLDDLRAELSKQNLDGFLIPRADEYQGEFVAPYAERLKWLTGFTGSGGAAIVLSHTATVMTDGRYLLQVRDEVDQALYETSDITKVSIGEWLAENAGAGAVIGYDPWLHTPVQIKTIERKADVKSVALRAVSRNPVDHVRGEALQIPATPVEIFPDEIAGYTVREKCEQIAALLREEGVFAAIITLPDSIAWLLNIRAQDIRYIPLALSYLIVNQNGSVIWFIEPGRVSGGVQEHIGAHVQVVSPSRMAQTIADISDDSDSPVGLDFARSPIWFKSELEEYGAEVVDFKDPCIEPKALKAVAEQAALKDAHIRDGTALVNFLYWLDNHGEGKTELDIVEKLEQCRRENPSYKGMSFPTIAGFGANGAIIHYRPSARTNKTLEAGNLLLVDSGGQYEYGTTDITRTIAIGKVSPQISKHYTRVLQGHIAVASTHFPEGTTGAQIDAMARKPLWNDNLDYAHGTGHGVGCYLAVHEEAASLSPRGKDALGEGMLLSNEPGYYKEGSHGIRIENLVLVQKGDLCADTGKQMMYFETVSYAPIDLEPVQKELLSEEDRAWINAYHARVLECLSPHLEGEVSEWLKIKTAAI